MQDEVVLRDGLVLTPGGPVPTSVHVRNGVVSALGDIDAPGAVEIDCRGAWVGPGLVDLHTHLREPGQEHKEDIASGSAAAAAGGYTAVVAMPNTSPPIDTPELVGRVRGRGESVGLVEVVPAACVTERRAGARLADLRELWDAGVRVFSDDGDTVSDAGLMRRALEHLAELGGVLSQHAVDAALCMGGHMHEGAVAARLGIAGVPAVAEEVIVLRDLALVRLTGARYHLQHAATATVIDLIAAARDEGLPVTVEVTPHHLMFDESSLDPPDTNFKMMPPLRTARDRGALRDALRSGVVDVVATDHAPHSPDEKAAPFVDAPNGVIGLEWAAAVVNTTTQLEPEAFFDRLSVAPARIAGLDGQGQTIRPGVAANLVVFDPNTRWTPVSSRSKSRNAPYLELELTGIVRATMFRGRTTWLAERERETV